MQDAALDSTRPLADALRAAVAAAGKLGSTELRQWATRELNGYEEPIDLPDYRKVAAPLLMDYTFGYREVTGQNVDLSMLDKEVHDWINTVPIRAGVAEIAALASDRDGKSVRLTFAGAAPIASMIKRNVEDASFLNIHAVYFSVSRSSFTGALDQVRTRLVDLVAEYDLQLRQPGVSVEDAAVRAMNITVGDNSTVHLNAAQGNQGSISVPTAAPATEPHWWESGWWTTWRTLGAAIVGVSTVVATLLALDAAGHI
nr:hypothetical protein [Cellulomonas xiejunii]